MRRLGRSLRVAALALALAAGVGACALGDKAAYEDRITAAPGELADAGPVEGTVTVAARLTKVPLGAAGPAGIALGGQQEFPEDGVPIGQIEAGFLADMDGFRAALILPEAEEPFLLFDGLTLYGRRADVEADDSRPWVQLDIDDLAIDAGTLDPLATSPLISIGALDPVLLLDLIAGSLTGSIEVADEAEGTTTFDANFDIDKTFRDTRRSQYPESRRDALEDVFDLLAIDDRVHDGQVTLDDSNRPTRFSVQLTQEPAKGVEVVLDVVVEVIGTAAAFDLAVPDSDHLLRVDSLVRFLGAVVPAPEQPAPGVPPVGIPTAPTLPPAPDAGDEP